MLWMVIEIFFLLTALIAGQVSWAEVSATSTTVQSPAMQVASQISGSQAVSGTPRVMRSNQVNGTEVFFLDLSKSYFIPTDSQHNSKYEIFNKAITGKKGVSFVAHPVSRQILWVEGARVDSKGPEEEPAADEEKNSDKKSSVNLSPSGSSTTGGRSSPNR